MSANSIFDSKLATLKEELKTIEANTSNVQKAADKHAGSEWWYMKEYRRSKTCLTLSIILSIAVILAAVLILYPIMAKQSSAAVDSSGFNGPAFSGCLFLTSIALHIINFILLAVSEEEFSFLRFVALIVCAIPPISCVAPFVEVYRIIGECSDNKMYYDSARCDVSSSKSDLQKLQKKLEDTKKQIARTEVSIKHAEELYRIGLEKGDEASIQKAAKQGCVAAEKYVAKKLYDQAMAADPIDEAKMEEAAKLEYVPACLYLGKKYFSDLDSNLLTAGEKKYSAKEASKYLEIAAAEDMEAEFLWYSTQVIYDYNTLENWNRILGRLRKIKSSGKLPAHYANAMDLCIQSVVETIDRTKEEERHKQLYSRQPSHTSYPSPSTFPSDSSWSPDKGLNTYYTDSRNGQIVYYKDGQYVNEDGERVPLQYMDD